MRKVSFNPVFVLLCAAFITSCGDSTTSEKKPEVAAAPVAPKPKWADPGRGKVFGKVNYVQIPLTAYEEHIFGEVKSVTYKSYAVAEDGSKKLDDSGYNVYDKAGHLIDQNEYDKDGKAKWNCTYKYDDQNRATLWDIKVYRSKTMSQVTFKYDDKGRKTEQNETAAKKEDWRRLVYKYDDKGRETEEAEYYGEKDKPWTSAYKYDSRGFQVEYTHKDETGRLLMKHTREYDSLGNVLSGAMYTSDTVIRTKWVNTNDNLGRTIESKYYKGDGTPQGSLKFKYDDWDNITEFTFYKADGSVDTTKGSAYTEYEYDSKGNPVKETSYKLKDGKKVVTDISEKKYEYY